MDDRLPSSFSLCRARPNLNKAKDDDFFVSPLRHAQAPVFRGLCLPTAYLLAQGLCVKARISEFSISALRYFLQRLAIMIGLVQKQGQEEEILRFNSVALPDVRRLRAGKAEARGRSDDGHKMAKTPTQKHHRPIISFEGD